VDGTWYDERLATLLMLDLGGPGEVGASRRPLRMWVACSFTPKAGEDGVARLAAVRKKARARLAKEGYAWKLAWIDDQGREVIQAGPEGR
jgi:hypothetical protein